MKFLKNNMWTALSLALVMVAAFTGDASAASNLQVGGSDVMSTALTKGINVFKSIRTIVFVLGGFGLVGLAVQAIFGKVKWPWFGALAVGLGVLAAAGAVINYATGDDVATSANMSDSFGQSGTGAINSN